MVITGADGAPIVAGLADEAAAPLTRRERQRQATHDEIVSVARRVLSQPDGLTLRAVAAEMGMTAPALYRYVDGHQHLVLLVAQSVFADVHRALADAYARYPDDDPAAQLLAACTGFRRWALANRAEFGLLFASASTAHHDKPVEPGSGEDTFAAFFADIYLRVWDRYHFHIPTDDELDPDVLNALVEARDTGLLPCDFPGMPIGLSWLFIQAWARLYGTVTLEVFKHMNIGVIGSGALFRSMLDDNARDMGLDDDWPRLQALVDAEMKRSSVAAG